jgi:hypothetical protein
MHIIKIGTTNNLADKLGILHRNSIPLDSLFAQL